MFDAAGSRRATRHPEGNRATGIAPASVHRHEEVRTEAAIGVQVRREDRHGLRQCCLQAANRMAKTDRAFIRSIVENIVPLLILYRAVDMQAIARLVRKGFGHEACKE